MTDEDQPWFWLIGGPNGAGKTTLAAGLLGHELNEDAFLNADVLARSLNPEAPEKMAFAAGRLLVARLGTAIATRQTVAVETMESIPQYFFAAMGGAALI